MTRLYRPALALYSLFLLAACNPGVDCPEGLRASGGACLAPGGSLSGTASRAGSGAPAHGLQVALLGTDRVAITDEAGAWAMEAVRPGTYTLEVSADGYRPASLEGVAVTDGGHTTVDPVALEPEAAATTVTGVVQAPDAPGAEGALVFLERTGHVTLCDADGAFRLPGVEAGAYTLVVRHVGFQTERRPLSISEQDATVALEPIVLTPVEVPAPEVGAVTGAVTFGTGGAAAAGVQVYLEGTHHTAFTDTTGRFALEDVPTGIYALGAALPEHQVARVAGVTVVRGETTDVGTVALQPVHAGATVTGVVRAPGGLPAAGALVVLEGTDHVGLTDLEGAFALSGVAPGVYALAVRLPGYELHRLTLTVTALDVAVTVADVVLVPEADPSPAVGLLTGRVVYASNGAPASGVLVYVEGTGLAASSDLEGFFRIADVPVGTWALGAALPGYRVVRVDGLKVLEDRKTDAGTLALKPVVEPVAGALSGNVRLFGLDAHGGITVTLTGPDGSARTAATAPDGSYAFADLPQGLYRVGFEHPPWQSAERPNLAVAAGEYVVEDVTLRLGRRIDDRILVEAVPVVGSWVMAWFEGEADPVLLDAAGDRRLALPPGTVQALAANLDHVLLLVHQPVLQDTVVQLVDLDLVSGQTRPIASRPVHLRVHAAGAVYTGLDETVWGVGLQGAPARLLAEPPCTDATVAGLEAGPAPGWMRIGWAARCGAFDDPWQYHRPADGVTSPVVLRDARLAPGHLLALTQPPGVWSLGRWVLSDLDLVSGLAQTVVADVEEVDLGVPTLVQRAGASDYSGPVWQVNPETLETTQLLADGSLGGPTDPEGGVLLRSTTPEALWGFARPAGTLTQLCAAPYSASHTGGTWRTCREGAQAPYTVSVHHIGRGVHRVVTTDANWAGAATGDAGGIVWRTGSGLWAAVGESGVYRMVCNGNLLAHAFSAAGRDGVFYCESNGSHVLTHVDVEAGVFREVLPGTSGAGPSWMWCQLGGEGGNGVLCDYDGASGLAPGWSCGTPDCTVAYSATYDRRFVFPGDGWTEAVFDPDGHALATRSTTARQHIVLSGQFPRMTQLASVDRPLAIGPWGGASLWRTGDLHTAMGFADGRVQTVDYSQAEPLNLPGTDVWLTSRYFVDLSAKRYLASQYDIYERVVTEDGEALTWRDGTEYWRYAWLGGRERLAARIESFAAASRYYWDEDTTVGLGSTYRRDPQTGRLDLVAEEVHPFRMDLGGDRWLLFVDPREGTDQTYLAYLGGPDGPFSLVASQASLASLPWLDPDVAPRVAFNGWTPDGLALRVAELDGSTAETLGPPAVAARLADGDGRVSFASRGVWWHEASAPSSATPVDDAASLEAPLAFTADGARVVYTVEGAGVDAGRRGVWVAELP